MINVVELYQDVTKDQVNVDQNGSMSILMFNRLSRRAELSLLDWLTGDVSGQIPPAPWLTQKNKDWLTPFLIGTKGQVENGIFVLPKDYYQIDNWYVLGGSIGAECNDEEPQSCDDKRSQVTERNIPIELLDGQEFNERIQTFIEEIRPTYDHPISKQLSTDQGKVFKVEPQDVGSIGLEYIRYPKFAAVVARLDQQYNDMVPDSGSSSHYEWDEAVRPALIWIIADLFSDNTREEALKKFNANTGKSIREQK